MPITYKRRKGRSPSLDWLSLKREFFERNMRGEILTLKEFAASKNISFGHLRNKAAKDKWLADLEDRLDVKHTHELAEVKKAHERAIARLRAMAINEEVSVRSRHASLGRTLQTKAYERFKDMKPEELNPRDAVSVMRLGIEMEKAALGLGDKLETGHPLTNPQEEIERQTHTSLRTKDVDQILADVLESIWKGKEDEPTREVEPGTTH